jgi:uncharacterized protein
MKRVICLISILVIFLTLASPAYASAPLIVDNAGLLSAGEEKELQEYLQSCSDDLDMDVVVVTVNSVGGDTVEHYAEQYCKQKGYADDCAMLLISMELRDWYIYTHGKGSDEISDSELDEIADSFVSKLSAGNYLSAFKAYGKAVAEYAAGMPEYVGWLICIGIGILVGLISVLVMKAQLKSVHMQNSAGNYVVDDSFHLTGSHDFFLYRTVTRTRMPSSSGSGAGGGGGRGRGGKF